MLLTLSSAGCLWLVLQARLFWEKILTFEVYYNKAKQQQKMTFCFLLLWKRAHLVIPIAHFPIWLFGRHLGENENTQKVYLTSSFYFFLFWFLCWVQIEFVSELFICYIEHGFLKKGIFFVGERFQFYALYKTNAFTSNNDLLIWLNNDWV